MDFEELVVAVAKILDRIKIPYAITGGYALAYMGRLRTTFDIDTIIELPHAKIDPLVTALGKISDVSCIDKSMVIRAVERQGEFNFIHPDSGIKVDFWVQGRDSYAELKLKRRRARSIGGYKVFFVSPEDLILAKLVWHKASGSEQQLRDVQSVILMQKKLNWPHLWKWSKRQGTATLLKKLKAEA